MPVTKLPFVDNELQDIFDKIGFMCQLTASGTIPSYILRKTPSMNLTTEIEKAVKQRRKANEPIWRLIRRVNHASHLTEDQKEDLLRELYQSLTSEDLRERDIYEARRYDVGVSYRAGILEIQRVKKAMKAFGLQIFPGGNPKIRDRAFASSLGIPVPATYQQAVPLSDIRLRANTILKPVEGAASKGVFYVDRNLDLHSVKSSKIYPTIYNAREEISKYSASISEDRWILEQAILKGNGSPANDFKVFAFYGVAGMFLEIDRITYPETRYATYDRNGKQIERGGKYVSFTGSGVPDELYVLAERLSLASPVPILRLDFHHGSEGLFLGEITPHPGGTYFGSQSEEIDRMLGRHLDNAKGRLIVDLINGKQFPEFFSAYDARSLSYA